MSRMFGSTIHQSKRWPLMMRLKGTVILQIWWQVLLVGIYSSVVYVISRFTDWKMGYTLNLVSVMGMVVSLLLVFRTNTAYDRYWEGRRLWSQMTLCIRNLTRTIWVCVGESDTRELLEKKSAINLLVAFAFATKHYLREEYGYNYDDMVDLLSHIPKYSIPTSVEPMEWRVDIPTDLETLSPGSRLQPPRQQAQNSQVSSQAPDGRVSGTFAHGRRGSKSKQALAFDFLTPTNIPVELSYYIGSYIKSCQTKGKLDPSTLTLMNNALVSMVDCLTGFERILRTPIPLAYSIHLHHATWIYILALPFQLVANMGGLMILSTMIAAFTLLGILGIGYEIENPFNDDYNDLPLDDFCKVIQAEVDSMVSTRAPVPTEWVFSENNYPLAQSDLSAKELSLLTLEEVHALMKADVPHQAADDRAARRSFQYTRSVTGNGGSATAVETSTTGSTLAKVNSNMGSAIEKK